MEDTNFDTCKHRSEHKIVYSQSPCCGDVYDEGFTCYRLNIKGLTPDICQYCEYYEQKEEN